MPSSLPLPLPSMLRKIHQGSDIEAEAAAATTAAAEGKTAAVALEQMTDFPIADIGKYTGI